MEKYKCFISYSSKDREWKERVARHLEASGRIEVLADSDIRLGDEWYPMIEHMINESHFSILLISTHFLTSDFIMNKELPFIYRGKELSGKIYIPLIIYHCSWEHHEMLNKVQVYPDKETVLSLPSGNVDIKLKKLTNSILERLSSTKDTSIPRIKKEINTLRPHIRTAPLPYDEAVKNPELTRIHISDLHFGQGDEAIHKVSQRVVCDKIIEKEIMENNFDSLSSMVKYVFSPLNKHSDIDTKKKYHDIDTKLLQYGKGLLVNILAKTLNSCLYPNNYSGLDENYTLIRSDKEPVIVKANLDIEQRQLLLKVGRPTKYKYLKKDIDLSKAADFYGRYSLQFISIHVYLKDKTDCSMILSYVLLLEHFIFRINDAIQQELLNLLSKGVTEFSEASNVVLSKHLKLLMGETKVLLILVRRGQYVCYLHHPDVLKKRIQRVSSTSNVKKPISTILNGLAVYVGYDYSHAKELDVLRHKSELVVDITQAGYEWQVACAEKAVYLGKDVRIIKMFEVRDSLVMAYVSNDMEHLIIRLRKIRKKKEFLDEMLAAFSGCSTDMTKVLSYIPDATNVI